MRVGDNVGPYFLGVMLQMLLELRKLIIGRWFMMALLGFAFGPGIALHELGDTHHYSVHDYGHDHGEAFAGISLVSDNHEHGACQFDHEHDQSHASGVSIACLNAPQLTTEVEITAQPTSYTVAASLLPDSAPPPSLGKPPRATSHV